MQVYVHLRLSAARVLVNRAPCEENIPLYSAAHVPHFPSLFDILLSEVFDPGCSLQQGCGFKSHHFSHPVWSAVGHRGEENTEELGASTGRLRGTPELVSVCLLVKWGLLLAQETNEQPLYTIHLFSLGL